MSNGLPFERTRYNPVQDVTPEEAERNKRIMGTNRAAEEGAEDHGRRGEGPAKTPDPDPGKATA